LQEEQKSPQGLFCGDARGLSGNIRSQLEELRDLTENDDINENVPETAWAASRVLEGVMNAFAERFDHISSIHNIKEECQESDAKDLYREIG
jgi:hypothetical protein